MLGMVAIFGPADLPSLCPIQRSGAILEGTLAQEPGAPTSQFWTEVTTTKAIVSDLEDRERLEQPQEQHGLGRADTSYVDAAYVTRETPAQGRALIGPARPSCDTRSRLYTPEAFDVSMAEHRAVCPAVHVSTQCNRLQNRETGQVQYGFESGAQCDG
jgi:hypothetical protein